MKVDACKPATTAKKTCKPSPTQINIFSALDEELSNLKKKEPPKKLVPKIELSRTYQPPSKTTTVQPQPVLKLVFHFLMNKIRLDSKRSTFLGIESSAPKDPNPNYPRLKPPYHLNN